MLITRIWTALALLAVLLPALFATSPVPLVLAVWLLAVAGLWEWGRLNGLGSALSLAVAGAIGLAGLAAWGLGALRLPPAVWWAVTLLWVLGAAALLRAGVPLWSRVALPVRLLLGYAAVLLVWMAVVALREQGRLLLLSAMALVWVADIGGYFGGKAWGRRKLAPHISPGKSWAGAWTGAVAVLVVGAAWALLDARWQVSDQSLYTRLWHAHGWFTPAVLLALTALSVAGDLVESLVKRSAGVKDSSALLPGHGGVLDRVDALLPVLPAAVALLGV